MRGVIAEKAPMPVIEPFVIDTDEEEVFLNGSFDLASFFAFEDVSEPEIEVSVPAINLITELQQNSAEAVASISTRITEETFFTGAQLASGVFSALGSFIGACGPLYVHGLGSLSSVASSSNALGSSFPVLSASGLDIGSDGSFSLQGNVEDLAQATGFNTADILSGKYSALDIIQILLSAFFSEGVCFAFGLGLFDALLGAVLPSGTR